MLRVSVEFDDFPMEVRLPLAEKRKIIELKKNSSQSN
jgi:hypothetical protein